MDNLSPITTLNKTAIDQSYDHYYDSGYYDSRYPKANQNVLNFVLQIIQQEQTLNKLSVQPAEYSFLDFGCGNGRYLLPILQNCDWNAMAFDISSQAISQLKERLDQRQLLLRCSIIQQWPQSQNFHLALLLYGVLGHIKTRQERIELLTEIHQKLTSTLIISVPNIHRRFLIQNCFNSKQADIEYQRIHNNTSMHFHYHLYCLDELKQELKQSGFRIIQIQAESMLPEKWITHSTLLQIIDSFLCKILPVKWAYGILVCARHT